MSVPRVPAEHVPDLAAYDHMKKRQGLEVAVFDGIPAIELVVINPDLDVAGTADRFVTLPGFDLPLVFDLKTGHGAIEFGQVDIPHQLAGYATATHFWHAGELHPMPQVDQHVGLVGWMPAGKGMCELYKVDLTVGLAGARLCAAAREHRKLRPMKPFVERDQLGPLIDWLRARIRALPAEARATALRLWPADIPRKPDQIASGAQVDPIAAVLDEVEKQFRLPFPEPRPESVTPAPAPAPTQTATRPDPRAAAAPWTEAGCRLLAPLGDDATRRACARTALCEDRRMDPASFDRLASVVAAVTAVDGVVVLAYTADGPEVVVADGALDQLVRIHGTKTAALDVAKDAAIGHGLPTPRSLARVAESPLLVAMTAAVPPATGEQQQ